MLGGMAKVFDAIDDSLRAFIERQHVFFVATAPSGDGGHVNVSPKGGAGMFRVTGPLGFAYADMTRQRHRDRRPPPGERPHLRDVRRLRGAAEDPPPPRHRAASSSRPTPSSRSSSPASPSTSDQRVTVRSIITVDVTRVADACGYQVPRMDFVAERDQLVRYADNRLRKQGEDAIKAYATENNAESIDGLRGLDPLVEVADAAA